MQTPVYKKKLLLEISADQVEKANKRSTEINLVRNFSPPRDNKASAQTTPFADVFVTQFGRIMVGDWLAKFHKGFCKFNM